MLPHVITLLPTASEGAVTGRRPAIVSPLQALVIAAWFALLSGLGETALQAGARFILHRYTHQSVQLVWMAPLGDLILFTGTTGILLLLRWWRALELRTVVLVLAWLTAVSWLVLFSRLHKGAVLVLAAGLAVQAAHAVTKHPQGFKRLVRRSVPGLAVLVVAVGAGVNGWRWWAERRAWAALPPAQSGAPNVLLLILDTVRAASLSLYGYPRRTVPNLERLAARGVVFDQAFATAPWTLPSHASVFTGRWPHETSAGWRTPLDGAHPTLAEVLMRRGYRTGAVVANTYYVGEESGLARGFMHFEEVRCLSVGQWLFSSAIGHTLLNDEKFRRLSGWLDDPGRKSAAQVNHSILRWLDHGPNGGRRRPFFVFLNYYDAHGPYFPPAPFDTLFGPRLPGRKPFLESDPGHTVREIQAEIDAYDGAIASLDHELGHVFDELERRDLLENTLVIVTSDHGEEFGEHGIFHHGKTLYAPSLHVPLLIIGPSRTGTFGVPAAQRIAEPVSLRDLPVTVLSLLGGRDSSGFSGRSLARHWSAAPATAGGTDTVLSEVGRAPRLPARYPASQGDMASLVLGSHHYIRNAGQPGQAGAREELYDLDRDPWERHDLAGSDEGWRVMPRLSAALRAALAPEPSGKAAGGQ